MAMKKLRASFYQRRNVVEIARELLGKIIITKWEGRITSGRIAETEAYAGKTDKASHAYGGRRAVRTEVMYAPGGVSYVYLCYGIHHLFNIVTSVKDEPHAVLIRGIEPMEGLTVMLNRTGKKEGDSTVGAGPGNLSRALGIQSIHSGIRLSGNEIYIADDGYVLTESSIWVTPRIGVDYAGADALLPYRFSLRNSKGVSKRNAFSSFKND